MTEIVAAGSTALAAAGFDQLRDFTQQWLANRRLQPNTRLAYAGDIRAWLEWCEEEGLNPLTDVKFTHVNAWGRDLEHPPAGGKGLAPTSVARKMSALSSWYTYLLKLGAVPANPAAIADRPQVDRDYSATVAFDHGDAAKMLTAAVEQGDEIGPVGPVLAAWLVEMGTRATETCDLNIGHRNATRGYQIVQMTVKGGKRLKRTVPPPLAALLDRYLSTRFPGVDLGAEHADLPLFADATGNRLDRFAVLRFVKRLARRAGLTNAEKISPHSFRHAWNTMARAAGAELEDRQEALGHRDPRTTRRYDRSDRAVDHDPSLLIARLLAKPATEERE